MDRTRSERWPWWPALVAALGLTVLAYVPALGGELQFDDDLTVPAEAPVSWRDFLPAGLLGRPLTALTFAFNRATTGLDPVPLHATNVAIHLAASLVAWLLARATLREAGHPRADGLAVTVAGLFALHPMQAQAVAYIVQRSEALASAIAAAAILLMLRAERRWGERGGWAALGFAGIAFFAAVATKAHALATPAAWLAHRAFVAPPDPRLRPWRRRLVIAAPFVGAAALLSASFLRSLRDSPEVGPSAGSLGPWRYLLTQAGVALRYLRLLAWPAGQTIEHSVRESPGLLDAPTLAAVAGIGGLVGAALLLRAFAARRPEAAAAPAARIGAFGIAWFLLWLAPTSSVIPVIDLMFEHRCYLAALGPLAAAAVAVDLAISHSGERWRRPIAIAAVGAAWLALGALTGVRATVWSRADALWTEATRRSPGSARAHWNLGSALDRRGDLQGALASFSRAEAVEAARGDPPDPLLQQNVASVLRRSGRAAEARRVIERALARDGSNASLHDDLAILLLEAGDPEPAAVHAREAIRLAPGHAPFWETLAEVARDRGDPRGQVTALRRAAELDPRFPERDAELAELEARLGNAPGACAAWDRVLRWSAAGPFRARAVQRRGALGCGDATAVPAP